MNFWPTPILPISPPTCIRARNAYNTCIGIDIHTHTHTHTHMYMYVHIISSILHEDIYGQLTSIYIYIHTHTHTWPCLQLDSYLLEHLCVHICPVGWGCRIHRLLLCRGVRPPPSSVLDMTLNNLMVRFQQCWSFGECGVPLHRSQIHTGPEW